MKINTRQFFEHRYIHILIEFEMVVQTANVV